jgi:hypothetical protein
MMYATLNARHRGRISYQKLGSPYKRRLLSVSSLLKDGEPYWKHIPRWSNVSQAEFISYHWQVSLRPTSSQYCYQISYAL